MARLADYFTNLFQSKLFNQSARTYLFFILLFALIIRIHGITRDIPFIITGDVGDVFFDARHMFLRLFAPHPPQFKGFTIWTFILPAKKYLPAFKYFLFFGFSIAACLIAVYLQIFQGLSFSLAATEAAWWFKSSGSVIVVGRLVVLIFSLLTIYFVYRLGRELFSKKVGLTAALFLTVMPEHVLTSKSMVVDISYVFWTVLLAWFSYKIVFSGKLKYYLAAGIAFGVLLSTKYSAPFFGFFLLHAHFLRIRLENTDWTKMFWDKRVFYTTLMILVGLLLTFPAIFVQPDQYADMFYRARNLNTHTLFSAYMGVEAYWSYIPQFIDNWGYLFTLIIFAGAALVLFQNNKPAQVTVVTPLLFFLFFSFHCKVLNIIIAGLCQPFLFLQYGPLFSVVGQWKNLVQGLIGWKHEKR